MIPKKSHRYEYLNELIRNLINFNIDIKAATENIEKARVHMDSLHNEDDGFITIAFKDKDNWLQHHYKICDLEAYVDKVLSVEDINIYLSPNSFYKPCRRVENVRKLNALYIDLDYYALDNLKGLKPNQIIWQLENDYFKYEVPVASFIVITGRGIAIYWLIEPLPYKALPLWNAVQKHFLNKLKCMGADEKSIDAARVMRLPGSINQKNGQATDLKFYSDYRYNLRDIQAEYLPELTPYVNNPYHKKAGRKKKVVNLFNLYSLHYARLCDLVKLMEIRQGMCRMADGSLKETGQRELMCLLYRYWGCCYESDLDNALKATLGFNELFKKPLSEAEVIRATKSAEDAYKNWLTNNPEVLMSRDRDEHKKGYNYTNKTLIRTFNINEIEMKELRTIIDKKEIKRRNNERTKKNQKEQRRNENGLTKREQDKQNKINRIIELYKQGLKQKEIAEQLKISIAMVKKYYALLGKYLKKV